MENMDLNNAEVAVTTQHILDGKEYKDYWVQMSDYSDMGEFLCACSDLFPEETDPEYRYTKWENIPDRLINHEWICPNFFEIRDAMERLDENEREYFVTWSEHFGYDITTDDPHMMVSHYQDIYGTPYRRPKRNLPTSPTMLWYIRAYRATSAICFLFSMRYSMITTTKIKDIWKSVSKDR